MKRRPATAATDAGRLEAAEARFRRAVQIAPHDEGGWLGVVQVHLQRGEAQAAAKAIERHLIGGPNDAYARQLLAAACRDLGRFEQARLEAARGRGAARLVPDRRAARIEALATGHAPETERGLARLEAGRCDEAIRIFQRLRAACGEDRGVLNNLGLALLRGGDAARAGEVLESALALDRDFAPSARNLALAQAHAAQSARELERPFALIEQAIASIPADSGAWEVKAYLHLRRGEREEALEAYGTAAQLAPENAAVRLKLARLRLDGGELDEAEAVL